MTESWMNPSKSIITLGSSIMNSIAVCRLSRSNPSDTKCLDVTLLPQNISDGMLLNPKEDFTVEWNCLNLSVLGCRMNKIKQN